ncbi:glycosyltransferase [Streptomyces roseifaciens]|uniref:glycosyltransferase n=1 Tax=Streptomyces roseifaciens TaxID=1488406 RepID=UPI000717FEAD|nr:glycosyltransferase [Streptomyces roseifaciens]
MRSPLKPQPATPQRILLATWGTTGDIAPYTGLATGLSRSGHQVTVVTSQRYAALFREHGLRVRAMPLDEQEAAVGAHKPRRARIDNGRDMALTAGKALLEAAGEGTDVLLAHPLMHPQAAVIGEGLRLPCTGVYTVSHAMMLPRLIAGTPRLRYTAADALVKRILRPVYAPATSALRRELGLSRRFTGDALIPSARRHTVYYGFGSALLPDRLPLPAAHRTVGIWRPAQPPNWRPDDRLTDFLASGPAPVYFGFGSMGRDQAERLSRIITRTVRRLRIRAVVQGGWAGLTGDGGDDILTIGECPHAWLFPRMTAAVHHAGLGTTHASLQAALPTLPVPFKFDQPFWAARLRSLGLTPAAIPMPRLDSDSLGLALTRLLADGHYRERTRRIGARIEEQDGIAGVVRALGHAGPAPARAQ